MRPTLGLTEAATACRVSRRTIERRLHNGTLEGAHKDTTGQWVIPLEGLLAAGFHPNAPTPPEEPAPPAPPDATVELDRLRAELDRERTLRVALEANLEDLRLALRTLALNAPTEDPQNVTEGPQTPPQDAPTQLLRTRSRSLLRRFQRNPQ